MALNNDSWQRVLLICPHPDDETLGAGILLQEALSRGAQIRVVYLTDGDRNPLAQVLHEGEWPLTANHRRRFGDVRRGEALRALATLGVNAAAAEFWHLPDRGLRAACEAGSRAEARLIALIGEFQPTMVVAPTSRDLHVDHLAAAFLVRRAIHASCADTAHLTYRVHGEIEYDDTSLVMPDSRRRQSVKSAAMNCHRTQLLATPARMLQLVARDELFRDWNDEAALPPVRFRGAQRLLHLLPSFQPAPAAPAEEPELLVRP